MKLADCELDILIDEAESIGMVVKKEYAGRAGFGHFTIGVVGAKAEFTQLLCNLIEQMKYAAINDEIDIADNYQNIVTVLLDAKSDNFGLDFIWY